jgi:hypothetical protein
VGPFPNFLRFLNKIENWDRFLAVQEIEIFPLGAARATAGGGKVGADPREIETAQEPTKSIQLVVTTYTHTPKQQGQQVTAEQGL